MIENIYFNIVILIAQCMLIISLILVIIKLIISSTIPDRILCLDIMITIGIGFIVIFVISTKQFIYIDIVVVLGLISFLTTVALTRYITMNKKNDY